MKFFSLKSIKWSHVLYDFLSLQLVYLLLFVIYDGGENFTPLGIFIQSSLIFVCVFTVRFLGGVYRQIWRYGGIQCYTRIIITDAIAFFINYFVERVLPIEHILMTRLLSIFCLNLLCALSVRMFYRYAYKYSNSSTRYGRFLNLCLRILACKKIKQENESDILPDKIKIAIIGAGRVGVALAEELLNNKFASYVPCCFIDTSADKIDRTIHEIPVLGENEKTFETLKTYGVQEVVFAIPNIDPEQRKKQYERYLEAGYKIKVYDFPVMQSEGGRRRMREFDIEELLFRKPVDMDDEKTVAYYRDKVILITGGGGSIGSELVRQLSKMSPKSIIVLDIYENGAYDLQQELKIKYGDKLDLKIEIASITSKRAMSRVFETYHPDIVINAAAHKHVPLMEHNCIEAIENNVFGTKNLIELCEQFGTSRFMMVSTDKAVNPTNVMGATKRMCEMLVECAAANGGKVKYSATRFGNVLGSAGSVIPLFKRQIANGGPITLTDKRIIRYFMTIPEASQLVLKSGAMAKNGELFVLDMGQPIKIIDLARNMIRLAGMGNIEIIETGLRPGEKLYEELLVKTEELDKTENSLIFIERDTPYTREQINEKLALLASACESGDDEKAREALRQAVETFKAPEEVNKVAENAEEMKIAK